MNDFIIEDFELPQTDEDVIAKVNNDYQGDLTKKCLIGIYRCRRGMGEAVIQAYESMLRAHIEVSNVKN